MHYFAHHTLAHSAEMNAYTTLLLILISALALVVIKKGRND